MPTEYLFTLILEILHMPAEISAGILALQQQGVLGLCLSALNICFCMICISIKRSFFEQAGTTLVREPVAALAGGIVAYGLGLALVLVCLVSVVGFPIAALILLGMVFFIFIGQAALSVMFGKIFADKFYRGLDIYSSTFIGALMIEFLNYLPYVQWAFRFLVWPILALGVLYAGCANSARRIFYPPAPEQKPVRDRKRIREIVLRQTDKW